MGYKSKPLLLFIVLCFSFWACSTKSNNATETDATNEMIEDDWKEMDDFHMIMAESFHPYMDSGNVEPAKANAAIMDEMAAKWVSSTLPGKVNNDEVRKKLKALHASTTNFKALATQADNTVLGDSLTRLHDLFHSIAEVWYDSDQSGNGH